MLILLFEGISKTTFYQLDCKFNLKGIFFMNKIVKFIHPIKGELVDDVYKHKAKKDIVACARA